MVQLRRPYRTVELLSDLPLFDGLRRRDLDELAPYVDEIERPAGRRLIDAGGIGYECFLVLDGALTVQRANRGAVTLRGGDIAGEMSLLTGAPRCADVWASDDAHLLTLDPRGFAALRRHKTTAAQLQALYMARTEDV